MIEDLKLSIIDENGNLKNIIIIDKFTKNNKNYLIYNEANDESELFASLYEIKDNKLKIIPITDSNDYDIVDEYLSEIE